MAEDELRISFADKSKSCFQLTKGRNGKSTWLVKGFILVPTFVLFREICMKLYKTLFCNVIQDRILKNTRIKKEILILDW